MARFAEVGSEDLEAILENKDSKNTRNSIKTSINVLTSYCASKDVLFSDLEKMPDAELCEHLKCFYAAARNQKGEFYSKKSMISLRYGIQRHFLKLRNIDIVNNDIFKPANLIFQAMMVKLKQIGKGASVHKPPIDVDDMNLLFNSFDMNKPSDLQNKVFIDFMLYFCNRGRENLRDLKKHDFNFHGVGDEKYVTLRDHCTKNHRGDSNDENESQGGRLYVVPKNPLCPVQSLEKYISVLNPGCDFFWQRPKNVENKTTDVWYDNTPVGKNTLGDKMKTLSLKANLKRIYTNHSLRATTITLLDDNGFEARHIMSLSGHKSEASIRSYARTGEAKRRKIAETISDKLIGNRTLTDHTSDIMTEQTDHSSDTNNAEGLNQIGHINNSSGTEDFPDLNDMDFLELTSSQEHLLMQSVSTYLPNENQTVNTRHVEHETSTSRVLTERTNNFHPQNMIFHHVKELHIHYHSVIMF